MFPRRRTLLPSLGLLLSSSAILATPVPPSAVGLNKAIVVNTAGGFPSTISGVGRGGGFAGSVAGNSTTLWCVDSQLFVDSGVNNFKANVVMLSDVAASPTLVHYGSVSGFGTSSGNEWRNDMGAGLNVASVRFQMAAWLVSQYLNFPAGPTPDNNTVAGQTNHALQKAIWRVLLNETRPFDSDVQSGDIATGKPAGYSDWIAAAKANYTSIDTSKWAVVSGGLSATAPYALLDVNSCGAKQTYLVQLVPEPGFYGVLALGLSALAMFRIRRRRAG